VIGFAFFTGAPSSPRKLARQEKEKVLKDEMDRQRGVKPPRGEAIAVEADATPFMSELVLLVCAGAVLFGAGPSRRARYVVSANVAISASATTFSGRPETWLALR
jgi:hypothetical protein